MHRLAVARETQQDACQNAQTHIAESRARHGVGLLLACLYQVGVHTEALQDFPVSLLLEPACDACIAPQGIVHAAEEEDAVEMAGECDSRPDEVHLILHLAQCAPAHIYAVSDIVHVGEAEGRSKLAEVALGIYMNEILGICMQGEHQAAQLCGVGVSGYQIGNVHGEAGCVVLFVRLYNVFFGFKGRIAGGSLGRQEGQTEVLRCSR